MIDDGMVGDAQATMGATSDPAVVACVAVAHREAQAAQLQSASSGGIPKLVVTLVGRQAEAGAGRASGSRGTMAG